MLSRDGHKGKVMEDTIINGNVKKAISVIAHAGDNALTKLIAVNLLNDMEKNPTDYVCIPNNDMVINADYIEGVKEYYDAEVEKRVKEKRNKNKNKNNDEEKSENSVGNDEEKSEITVDDEEER
jgi:ABC-type multidrug transport system ATPase subunit